MKTACIIYGSKDLVLEWSQSQQSSRLLQIFFDLLRHHRGTRFNNTAKQGFTSSITRELLLQSISVMVQFQSYDCGKICWSERAKNRPMHVHIVLLYSCRSTIFTQNSTKIVKSLRFPSAFERKTRKISAFTLPSAFRAKIFFTAKTSQCTL